MSMQKKIHEAQNGIGLDGENETQVRFYENQRISLQLCIIIRTCLMHFIGLAQEPQLSSSEPFDIHSKLVAI